MLGIKSINRCDVFIALNILYSMQGLLYPSGIINQILQLVIIVWGLIISSRYILGIYKQTKMLKATSALVFMYSLYGGVLILFGLPQLENIPDTPAKYIYLQVSLRSLLNIYVFYHYASKGILTTFRICVYAVILLLSFIPKFYYEQARILFETNREEMTNNMGYTFLAVLPTLFFFQKKPLLQYILLAVTLLYIVMAMKRGAIIIGLVATIALVGINIFSSNSKYKFWSMMFSVVLVTGAVYFVSKMMSESDYFAYRVEQTLSGDSSGRDDLYGTLWHSILNEQNMFYILFGRGADSTWAVAGNYAHQDWLETLCNNGLAGCVILLCFFLTFFRDAFSSRTIFSKNFYAAYMALFVITMSKTMFSMSIQSMEVPLSMLLGYFTYWVNHPCRCIAQRKIGIR